MMNPLYLNIDESMEYDKLPVEEGLRIGDDPPKSPTPDDNSLSLPASRDHKNSSSSLASLDLDAADFAKGKFLGMGAYGRVMEGFWKEHGKVALKIIECGGDHLKQKRSFDIEIGHLSRLRHPHIIEWFGSFNENNALVLVLEYMENGDLYKFLHEENRDSSDSDPFLGGHYTIDHSISYIRQVADGCRYLHSLRPKSVIHRDIKPQNILLRDHYRVAKIGDFGTAVDIKSIMTDMRGTALWMAPEVANSTSYNAKCDVYSLTICLWEVLARKRPYGNFENFDHYAFLYNITIHHLRPPLLEGCPPEIDNLLLSGWDPMPEKRPTMEQFYQSIVQIQQDYPDYNDPIFPQSVYMASNIVEVPLDGDAPAQKTSIYSPDNSGIVHMVHSWIQPIPRMIETPFSKSEENLHIAANDSISDSQSTVNPNHCQPTCSPSISASASQNKHKRRGGSYDTAFIVTNERRHTPQTPFSPSSAIPSHLDWPGTKPVMYSPDHSSGNLSIVSENALSPDTEVRLRGMQEIYPLAPLKHNADSQEIYEKHCAIIKQYLALDQDIKEMMLEKERLTAQLRIKKEYDDALQRNKDLKNRIEALQDLNLQMEENMSELQPTLAPN